MPGQFRWHVHFDALDEGLCELVDFRAPLRRLVTVGVRGLFECADDGFAAHRLHLHQSVQVVGGVLRD